ncbi:MAG: FAD-dependent oxidoreductase [Solirubrobacterales bacterium]
MRVAVLGAGMAGLAAGHRLTKLGHEADVYERWPGLGGQAATIDVGDGVLVERYYHHLFTSDQEIHDLAAEIGVELERWPSSVAMLAEGELHPFTGPLDLIRYSPMSPLARLRMGLAVVWLQKRANSVEPFESQTIKQWVVRAMGPQAWEKIWEPLLWGKFRDQADEISMSWLWAKLRNRRQVSGEEAKGEILVYPEGSFESLFVRLRDLIAEQGGRVLIDRPAARIARENGSFLVYPGKPDSFRRGLDPREFETDGEPERYDAVIAALPTDIFEEMLDPGLRAEVGDAYLERAGSIEYFAALCLLCEVDRQFHPYYWTNVADRETGFIGLIEQTNLVPPERYGGRRFLYVANYLPRDHPLLEFDMDSLLDFYEPGLKSANPAYERSWIKQSWLFREPAAQPVVLPNYRDRLPPYETGVPGLLLANTTQVYPDDRGTNYAVREADEVVELLLGSSPEPA